MTFTTTSSPSPSSSSFDLSMSFTTTTSSTTTFPSPPPPFAGGSGGVRGFRNLGERTGRRDEKSSLHGDIGDGVSGCQYERGGTGGTSDTSPSLSSAKVVPDCRCIRRRGVGRRGACQAVDMSNRSTVSSREFGRGRDSNIAAGFEIFHYRARICSDDESTSAVWNIRMKMVPPALSSTSFISSHHRLLYTLSIPFV